MKVHILIQMNENIIERVSTDLQKMNDCAEALNEGKGVYGSYGVESVELEDDFHDELKEEIRQKTNEISDLRAACTRYQDQINKAIKQLSKD